jgi:hypothetical protein
MNSITEKVDQLIQYALLLAGEEDDFLDRQLGAIHLIKYVYLADYEFAKVNNGATYTGTDWMFYKFGPWAQSINARISPALNAINADQKVFESNYEEKEDWSRWCVSDEYRLSRIEALVPSAIRLWMRTYVHKFGKRTPELLDFVYKTPPMLNAAPHEFLDFSNAIPEPRLVNEIQPESRLASLTIKKQKRLKERMNELRAMSGARNSVGFELVRPIAPRYDEVFSQGISWLEQLAGPMIHQGSHLIEFSDEVWKSSTRKSKDVP